MFELGATEPVFLVLHLMIAGRLRLKKKGAAVPKRAGLAAFDFDNGTVLLTEAGTKRRASLFVVADEAGLGVGRPADIEVVGADISGESWGFQVGDNGASRIGDLLWFGPLKSIQNLFFRTPLVNVFILGSEMYHDFYRWPARDRRAFERWLQGTAWGHLFARYARGEGAPSDPVADRVSS